MWLVKVLGRPGLKRSFVYRLRGGDAFIGACAPRVNSYIFHNVIFSFIKYFLKKNYLNKSHLFLIYLWEYRSKNKGLKNGLLSVYHLIKLDKNKQKFGYYRTWQ